ncbi:hemolysin family protein [Sphingorhabdus sp.]|uniref:hemolysin family protein n=1 Tax=Sphingorhabdus sp. TaxID=1902408 RepID=UPI002FD95B1F
MSDLLISVAIILLLVAINGIFVAAEFALVASRRSRLQAMANGGSAAAEWLVKVFDRPAGKDAFIAIAQLGITLASIGLGMFGEPAIAKHLYPLIEDFGVTKDQSHLIGFVIALSLITYMHVVFGEMIPKALALQMPEQVGVSVNPVMRLFGVIFRPFVFVLNKTAFALMRLLRIEDPGKSAMLYTSRELEFVAEEVAASGQLEDAQRNLIGNLFDMDDRTVEELMTSRSRLKAIELSTDSETVATIIAESGHSRFPVYEESLDNVVGVLLAKDFIRASLDGKISVLPAMVRPIPRAAATLPVRDLLAIFKRLRTHAAVVVDEHGGTLGFVTMDDLVDDLIDDDEQSETDWISTDLDGSLLVDGEVTLAELAESHGLKIEARDVVTVAGLFLARYGTIPEQGAQITEGGSILTLEELIGFKIAKVRITNNDRAR